MRSRIFILFVFLCSGLVAQTKSDLHLNENDTLPEKFRLKVSELRDHIFSNIPEKESKNIEKRRLYNFADNKAFFISRLVSSGDIYDNWPELEEYMNKILRKVMPKEIQSDSLIHAYVMRDPAFGAFMTPSGLTFINVGLLTYIDDESSLASIIAHEFAHYYRRHALKTFIKNERGDFNTGIIFRNNNNESQYSIFNEYKADSLALSWLMAAGYNLDGAGKAFQIMKGLEENTLRRSSQIWEMKSSTHPLPQVRFDFFKTFREANPNYKGEAYLFGEEKFRQFQKIAREEVLKQELENFRYSSCIEKGFKFHLLDPGNIVYQEYILEGIRRSCYLNPDLWNENFVTHRYFEANVKRKNRKSLKPKYTKSLFESDDSFFLVISPEEHEKVKVRAYWEAENPIFKTNVQAFEFFYRIAIKFKSKEAHLSYALSNTSDTNVRNNQLRKYLSLDDIKHREYARALLKNTITQSLPNKTMYVVSAFDLFLVEGKERIFLQSENEEDVKILRSFLDTVSEHYKDSPLVHLNDLKYYNLRDYRKLSDLSDFAQRVTLYQRQKVEFQILEPRSWDLFKKLEVNEVKFISMNFVETRKSQKSMDTYNSALNMSFKDFFNQRKRTREFYLSVNSVRLQNDKMMKFKNWDFEELKFRKSAAEQLKPMIINILKEDIEMTKKGDEAYRAYLKEEKK